MSEDTTGFDLATGTVDEAQEMVGATSERFSSAEPINRSRIQFFASLIEDSNPSFWDEGFAKRQWGGFYAPLGMLRVWRLKPLWHPGQDDHLGSVTYPTDVPLPARFDNVINIRTTETSHRPALAGTRLHWQAELLDVTEQKSTGLGDGHFITTRTVFTNDDGLEVGEYENVMLRHESSGDADADHEPVTENRAPIEGSDGELTEADYDSITLDQVEEGVDLPSYDYPLSYRRIIHNVAATRDFFPGHYDPMYARSQGNRSIFLNTMTFQGLIDRLALDWAGPAWRVTERTISMEGSAIAGDNLTVRGSVTDVDRDGRTIEIEGGVFSENHERVICPTTVTITRGSE